MAPAGLAQRLWGTLDCITPVPSERWDLERIGATDDILQVGGRWVGGGGRVGGCRD